MKINQTKNNNTQNFTAKIRLCDKGVLDLKHNPKLLQKPSPMDFFYDVSNTKIYLDVFIRNLKSKIRELQSNKNNSELKKKILNKSFKAVNNLSTVINRVAILKNIPELYQSNKILKRTSPEKANYIDTWASLGNSTKDKTITINIEDKRIEEITKQDEPIIFIMNQKILYIFTAEKADIESMLFQSAARHRSVCMTAEKQYQEIGLLG